MGVTIHYKLGQRKDAVKATLDRAQREAEKIQAGLAPKVGIPFEIQRYNDQQLRIDIGGCETLAFYFRSVKEIEKEAEKGWAYEHAVLTDGGKKIDEGYEIQMYPQNEIVYCASFCKTQFGSSVIEHKWVADILRIVAAYCLTAEVSDEGDYYHTGEIENATEAIEENGKLISSIGGQLAGSGFEVIKGRESATNNMEKLQDAMNIVDGIINERLVVKPREMTRNEWDDYKKVTDRLQDILLDMEHVED